jgi:uncharacterized delta-60 repeat protein
MKTRRVRVSSALVFIFLLVVSQLPEQVRASGGDLDPSFGNGGIVTTDFLRGGEDLARAVAIQKDQKLVVAGGNSGNFELARYNPDGSLDTSFGQGGRVVTAFGTNASIAGPLVLQSDGKIIVGGSAGNSNKGSDFALVRYNTDGSLDASFGSGGRVITHLGDRADGSDGVGGLAIQPGDGRIVAAGSAQDSSTGNDFALARYNLDGSLDTSFDGDGRVTTDFSGNSESANGVALQPDGRIVAAGTTASGITAVGVARYNINGSLDTSFGTGGKVITGSHYFGNAIAVQPDGKVVVVGSALNLTFFSFEFLLVRYNPNGTLDSSFGAGGIVQTGGGDFAVARGVALQADGKILAFGGNGIFFLLARYDSNGALDTTLGGFGIVFTGFNPPFGSDGYGVAIQADGHIVGVGGTGTFKLGSDFALVRWDVGGALDTSFDADGKVTTDFPGGTDNCNAVAIQPDGKIVAVGGNAGDFALARYNPNGSLDIGFGNGGRVLTDFDNGFDLARAVAIQADGKIIVGGSASHQITQSDFALARYNTDGSLDSTFGKGGKVTLDFFGLQDEVLALAVQPDCKIVAAGGANIGARFAFALVRYNPDGSFDTTFDGDGRVVTSIGYSGEARALAIQPDGKLVAAGDSGASEGVNHDFGLARYNPNGSLDSSFNGIGSVVTDFAGRHDVAQALSIQTDGRIVVAGYSQPSLQFGSGMGDFALARYNTNGTLDTAFDDDGKVITNASNADNDDEAFGVAIQSDGKILAAGYASNPVGTGGFSTDFALARYNSNGSLDPTLGSGGIITTNIGNRDFSPDKATAMAIQPGDGKIVLAGETFNNGTGIDFALARYGVTDTTPPTITCPAGVQALTSRPRDVCATVSYPPPVVSDNLPGATVVCAPPSGSCFGVGTTTVSCTATDAAGNTASCSFAVTVFDVLLQSDSDHNVQLLINSFSGDYSFCCPQLPPGQSPLRGRGQMVVKGSTFTLTHNAPTYRLQATIDAAAGKASASFKPLSGLVLCPIQDRNIYDNLPLRCGNPMP